MNGAMASKMWRHQRLLAPGDVFKTTSAVHHSTGSVVQLIDGNAVMDVSPAPHDSSPAEPASGGNPQGYLSPTESVRQNASG
jgi:hypothetical protein